MAKGNRSEFYKRATKNKGRETEPETMLQVEIAKKFAKAFGITNLGMMRRIEGATPRLVAKMKAFKALKAHAKRQKAMKKVVDSLIKKK